MTFAQPLWILAGLIVCTGVLILFRHLQARRLATLEKFAAAHLLDRLTRNVSTRRQLAKKIIFVLALFCCFLALARPQYGFRWEDVKRKGIDILFAVDTSKSMLAADIKPNRLERAKYAIMDFVDQLNGDRIGLLPFAGAAYLMCPLTGDYGAFADSLKALDTAIIPKGGTDIAAAIKEAESVLTNAANHKFLILITDGENLEGDVLAAAEEAAKKGLRIFTVGVGTRQGESIPLAASGGTTGFVKDADGNLVVSHLDEAGLQQIAEKTDGLYAPLGNKGQGLQTIYEKKLALVPKEELSERRRKVPLERFGWPLAAAIGLLALEFMIGTRKSRPFRLPLTPPGQRNKIIGLLMLVTAAGLLLPPAASAADEEHIPAGGASGKTSGLFSRLLSKRPDDPRILYNSGIASYRNRKYDDAVAAFSGALKTNDLDLQELAYYNRGNAYFKKGEETHETDVQQTLDSWRQAVASYDASLELRPDDHDAADNRRLVQKKIDGLKKEERRRQNQPQSAQQDTKDQEGKKEQQKQQQGQQKQQQGQPPQDAPPQQKPAPAQNGQSPEDRKQDPATAPEKNEPQAAQAGEGRHDDGKATSAGDNERRQQGKMTRENAEHLLDSLKDEEKRLNFTPTGAKGQDDPRRDW